MTLPLRNWLSLPSLLLSVSSVTASSISNVVRVIPPSTSLGSLDNSVEGDTAKYRRIAITHAVLACLAWALFAPLGAILLRSGIHGVNLLKLHAFWQLLVYTMYVAAAGLGIWMRIQLSSHHGVWDYPHAAIGLLILIGVFVQPWLGYTHHRIFKSRLDAIKAGDKTRSLGRTIITHLHLWLGRLLIVVGVINGGLGIMITWDRGVLQSTETSKRAVTAYSVIAGIFFLNYAVFMIRHESHRAPQIISEKSVDQSPNLPGKTVQNMETGKQFSVFLRRSFSKKYRNSVEGAKADTPEETPAP